MMYGMNLILVNLFNLWCQSDPLMQNQMTRVQFR